MNKKENHSFDAKIKEFLVRLKKREVSLLEERNFIEVVTDGYNIEKLQLLKQDVEFCISDERLDVEEKNYEIKRNTNDEYFLSGLTDEPAEGLFRPRLFRLKRLKRNIEYRIQKIEEGESRINDKSHKNKSPKLTKKDIIFKFLEYREQGFKVEPAVNKTRDWLKDNSIQPDTTKETFGITISAEKPDSFRKLADNYQVEFRRQRNK